MTVKQLLDFNYQFTQDGENTLYIKKDLKYDIDHGYFAIIK